MNIAAIVLTKNEELHIARAIASLDGTGVQPLVVDSGSTDKTLEIAENHSATVRSNAWINYASQFNWALEQLPRDTDWVLRLDADEVITAELAAEIKSKLNSVADEVDGIFVTRRMTFMHRPILHGGAYPIRVLRLFRYGKGKCENRWMDEHIQVEGDTTDFKGEIHDYNLNSLTWWTQKHNAYASREVVDLLNLKYNFFEMDTVARLEGGNQAGIKRWMKENVYARLPIGMRAFAYFIYRYIFKLGFLDGREGAVFHTLQGFWYRYLVDAKLLEITSYMDKHGSTPAQAIDAVLGIRLDDDGK